MAKINLGINGQKQVVDGDPNIPYAVGAAGSLEPGRDEVRMRDGIKRRMHD